ncbi:MAG: type IV pilus twitching motility protein PilT [Dehalococcoidia bacterium]
MGGATTTTSVHDLLRRVVETDASDLHMTAGAPPVLRINGRLVPEQGPALTPEATAQALHEVASDEQRASFAREQELDFAYSVAGGGRFRVNAAFQRGSVTLAFRPIRTAIPSLEELGLPEICASLALRPRGLVLVTGPTGSGKSTTLAAMIDFLNERREQHIVTIEDPIEFVHRHKRCVVSQREVGVDTGSFAAALKHVLRQDPDVILVGEMRDLETVGLALTAAETGHLVLATLHTPSASQTIDRVIDSFPPHQQQQVRVQLSTVLEAVLCQTLVPRADGSGRVAALEIMMATSAVRNLIREGKTYQIPNVIQTGSQQGMQSLEQSLALLARKGVISREDALAVSSSPGELERLLGGAVSRTAAGA